MDETLKALYWAQVQESQTPFFPYIKIDYSEEGWFKIKTEKDTINIGMSFEGQVLMVLDYYSRFNVGENKTDMETNKFSNWDKVILFDTANDDMLSFDKESFKEYKKDLKTLKYSRIAYIKPLSSNIPDGIYEMQIKLSQSHGMDKSKQYRFDQPIEDGFARFLNQARSNYAMKKVKVGINSFKIPPTIQVYYPTFTILGDTDISSQEVLGLVDRIKAVDSYKAKKIYNNNPSDSNKMVLQSM